jgi:hypothetical protein
MRAKRNGLNLVAAMKLNRNVVIWMMDDWKGYKNDIVKTNVIFCIIAQGISRIAASLKNQGLIS